MEFTQIEEALDKLSERMCVAGASLDKISDDVSLAATYLGDGAINTACAILAGEPRGERK